jgi:hypothetical protein
MYAKIVASRAVAQELLGAMVSCFSRNFAIPLFGNLTLVPSPPARFVVT